MGLRFRKSINLGGGFRINLSKSGVGYSWGVKGYRITKTAKGTIRKTASIPGTGFSYVEESGRNNSKHRSVPTHQNPVQSVDNNQYDTQNIVNDVSANMVSEGLEDMLAVASKTLRLNKFSTIGLLVTAIWGFGLPIMFIFAAAFLALKIYVKTKCTIDLDYSIDEDQQSEVDERMRLFIKITECAKTWRIMQTSKVVDKKYASGASNIINRTACKATIKAPFPFNTNVKVATFKSGRETLLFLPDKLFVIQGTKIGALNYVDISSNIHTTHFIESESVPRDCKVVGHTWKYVNKSGEPDKRFKDNRQLPICLYGKLELRSTTGLNTVIMFSNPNVNG